MVTSIQPVREPVFMLAKCLAFQRDDVALCLCGSTYYLLAVSLVVPLLYLDMFTPVLISTSL